MPGTSLGGMGTMGGPGGKFARPINMGLKNRRGNPSAERWVQDRCAAKIKSL